MKSPCIYLVEIKLCTQCCQVLGIDETNYLSPSHQLSIEREVNREQAHAIVDKFFDEFERVVA